MSQVRPKWVRGCKFLINEENFFRKQREPAQEIRENKKVRFCSGCHQPIGIISTMLYEIEEKLYCSDCYSRIISNKAIERNYYDLMQIKEA
jgi:hypothetical protein